MGELNKKNWGGTRTGSGRKKTTSKRYGFNADERVCSILEQVDSKTDFICEAILRLAEERGLIEKNELTKHGL